jgi:hypothetical protein
MASGCPYRGARCTPLVQRVGQCVFVVMRSLDGKGIILFVYCEIGNLQYDVASFGDAQIPHPGRAPFSF